MTKQLQSHQSSILSFALDATVFTSSWGFSTANSVPFVAPAHMIERDKATFGRHCYCHCTVAIGLSPSPFLPRTFFMNEANNTYFMCIMPFFKHIKKRRLYWYGNHSKYVTFVWMLLYCFTFIYINSNTQLNHAVWIRIVHMGIIVHTKDIVKDNITILLDNRWIWSLLAKHKCVVFHWKCHVFIASNWPKMVASSSSPVQT